MSVTRFKINENVVIEIIIKSINARLELGHDDEEERSYATTASGAA